MNIRLCKLYTGIFKLIKYFKIEENIPYKTDCVHLLNKKTMKQILQTIAGFGAHNGGTSTCTYDLLSTMNKTSCIIDLLTPESTDIMGHGESWIKAVPNDTVTPYKYSRNICRFLNETDYDIYHTNGLWLYCNHVTCSVARKKNKPYLITPHGMLYPNALHRSYWKKWPLIQLFFNKDIKLATCIHATCEPEMEYIRQFGYQGPIAVIPNPAILPDNAENLFKKKSVTFLGCNHPKKFGFLGRLHPRKKVENLLYGVSLVKDKNNCELVIMGKGDENYEKFLHEEVKRLGLTNIKFIGFVSGQTKFEELADLSALFVPSDFENFGMIITEALSVGTPVMASLGTPWQSLNTHQCGWWIDRTPENIADVMTKIINMPVDDLLNMGKNGIALVKANYTADKVGAQMGHLYEWILDGGEKPKFVYL